MKDKKYCNVRDNFRYTGEYRGAAHNIYNLIYSLPKKFLYLFIMDLTLIIILS